MPAHRGPPQQPETLEGGRAPGRLSARWRGDPGVRRSARFTTALLFLGVLAASVLGGQGWPGSGAGGPPEGDVVAVAIRAGQTFTPTVGEPDDPPAGWLALDLRAQNTGPRTVRVLGLGGVSDRLELPAGDVVMPPGETRLLLLRAQVSCIDERVPPPAPPVELVVAAASGRQQVVVLDAVTRGVVEHQWQYGWLRTCFPLGDAAREPVAVRVDLPFSSGKQERQIVVPLEVRNQTGVALELQDVRLQAPGITGAPADLLTLPMMIPAGAAAPVELVVAFGECSELGRFPEAYVLEVQAAHGEAFEHVPISPLGIFASLRALADDYCPAG
jgi:hypothetical protein